MSLGEWLQTIGGGLEFLSVGALVIGIIKTRRAFLDRPSRIVLILAPLRRLVRRILRRPVVIQARGASLLAAAQASGRGVVKPDWSRLSPEESVQRLQRISDDHAEMLDELLGRIEKEEQKRLAAGKSEQAARNQLGQSLHRRITEAATGGLTLEAWAAFFLALGIGLTVAGLAIE